MRQDGVLPSASENIRKRASFGSWPDRFPVFQRKPGCRACIGEKSTLPETMHPWIDLSRVIPWPTCQAPQHRHDVRSFHRMLKKPEISCLCAGNRKIGPEMPEAYRFSAGSRQSANDFRATQGKKPSSLFRILLGSGSPPLPAQPDFSAALRCLQSGAYCVWWI